MPGFEESYFGKLQLCPPFHIFLDLPLVKDLSVASWVQKYILYDMRNLISR